MMKNSPVRWFLVLILASWHAGSVTHAANITLPLSAKVTDANGLVIQGSRIITYTLYSTAEGGAPVWAEMQTNRIERGVLSVQLGSASNLAGVNLSVDLWLGIKVGDDSEMTPRVQVSSSRFGVPRGTIVMWSGKISEIPPGWAFCDGQNGTPDLRDRFVLGAVNSGSEGLAGGSKTHNHSGTTQPHKLTVDEIPKHRHTTFSEDDPKAGRYLYFGGEGAWKAVGGGGSNGDGWTPQTGDSGGDQAHMHGISPDSTLPPYVSLAYIIKL